MAGHTQRPAALSGRRLHDDRRKLAPPSKRARVHDAAQCTVMDALRMSLTSEGKASQSSSETKKKSKKASPGQREMLMAIPGKGEGKKAAAKEPKRSRPNCARKAG